MSKTAWQLLGRSLLVVAAAAQMAACDDESPVGPDRQFESASMDVGAFATTVPSVDDQRTPDLSPCPNLQIVAGSVMRLYARGVQIYHWNGASWSFDGPSAVLSADPAGNSTVGMHYGGPTWESLNGSRTVGTLITTCVPDPNQIAWLLLGATSTGASGIFDGVAWIQRVNTTGGKAPSGPGTFTGEEARVPYTAEYLFYQP